MVEDQNQVVFFFFFWLKQNQVVGRLNKALKDYVAPTLEWNMSSILRPAITANNFEITLAFIMMI